MINEKELQESWRVARTVVEEITPKVESEYASMLHRRFPHLTEPQLLFALSFLWFKLGVSMFAAVNQMPQPMAHEMNNRVQAVMNEYMLAKSG